MAASEPRFSRMAAVAALVVTVAVAFGGCSGSSTSSSAPSSVAPASQAASSAAASTGTSDSGIGAAVNAFSSIKSYKFAITMKGGTYGDMLGSAGMTGTVVVDPPASDVTIMGMEVREVGGKSYVKMGDSWVASTDKSTSSLADSLSPQKMFGSYLGTGEADGYKAVGDEQKNGVSTTHYTASADILSQYGSLLGVTGGTWTADVWVAKDGGYPVSMKIASTGGSSEFLMSIDITNINDPANAITAPN